MHSPGSLPSGTQARIAGRKMLTISLTLFAPAFRTIIAAQPFLLVQGTRRILEQLMANDHRDVKSRSEQPRQVPRELVRARMLERVGVV